MDKLNNNPKNRPIKATVKTKAKKEKTEAKRSFWIK
jgi:hypothetical protein